MSPGDASTTAQRAGATTDRIVVLSYYHPWIAGGGHRPHQIMSEDLRRGREVCYVFQSDAQLELIGPRLTAPIYDRLALFRTTDDGTQTLLPMSPHAERLGTEVTRGFELLRRRPPAYLRSHNPVATFLPLLDQAATLGIPHVYDIMDDWRAFPRQPWGSTEVEDRYLGSAAATTAVASRLVERVTDRPCRLVPNAVSHDFLDRLARAPRRVREPGAPQRVLYMGAIWPDWFDWSLTTHLVDRLPDREFFFVGPTRAFTDEDDGRDTAALAADIDRRPNVTMIPEVAHDELVTFLASVDTAIIPFAVNQVTEACSPLKVFEYLAADLPVVSTALWELVGYPQVRLATSPDDFVRQVDGADRERLTEEEVEQMRCFVSDNTWRQRVDVIDEVVAALRADGQTSERPVMQLSVGANALSHERSDRLS